MYIKKLNNSMIKIFLNNEDAIAVANIIYNGVSNCIPPNDLNNLRKFKNFAQQIADIVQSNDGADKVN